MHIDKHTRVKKEEGIFTPKLHGLPGSLVNGEKTYINGMVEIGTFTSKYIGEDDSLQETLDKGKRIINGHTEIVK